MPKASKHLPKFTSQLGKAIVKYSRYHLNTCIQLNSECALLAGYNIIGSIFVTYKLLPNNVSQ